MDLMTANENASQNLPEEEKVLITKPPSLFDLIYLLNKGHA